MDVSVPVHARAWNNMVTRVARMEDAQDCDLSILE